MKPVVKICAKHGELTEENIRVSKRKNGTLDVRCHFCKLEKGLRFREKNRERLSNANSIYKKQHREKINAYVRQDRLKDPEKHRRREKEKRERNREYYQKYEVARVRGLTVEQYDQMVIDQNNKCAICGLEETRKSRTEGMTTRLVIDHCHKTNFVRSLLCSECNTGLGKFKDSPELFDKAKEYILRHKKRYNETDRRGTTITAT